MSFKCKVCGTSWEYEELAHYCENYTLPQLDLKVGDKVEVVRNLLLGTQCLEDIVVEIRQVKDDDVIVERIQEKWLRYQRQDRVFQHQMHRYEIIVRNRHNTGLSKGNSLRLGDLRLPNSEYWLSGEKCCYSSLGVYRELETEEKFEECLSELKRYELRQKRYQKEDERDRMRRIEFQIEDLNRYIR